ncbi:MAG TPA: phosphatidate cytidylyltransferase, partial [Geobacterales bacterium]|nr:phosphatidate cytidylyltransferase [Geobacterales bacterium]
GNAALFLLGVCYVPLLLSHLVLLRALSDGVLWIFLMMTVVMSSDTAAYYVGSAIGRHKLYPAVSPNKSVEGAMGGLAGSVVGALIFRTLFFPSLPLGHLLLVALILGLLAQTGDLFESLLKRSFGVKDSGTLIPGHGGVLDRIDSILFAAPAAYYYALYLSLFH